MSFLNKKRVLTIPEYLQCEREGEGRHLICEMKRHLKDYGISLGERCKSADVFAVGLGLILYSERVIAAGDAIGIEPGFWKLISVIQKIVAALALLYSYKCLAKMAAKGEGTWKEVGYGLMIAAADYALPAAFRYIATLF